MGRDDVDVCADAVRAVIWPVGGVAGADDVMTLTWSFGISGRDPRLWFVSVLASLESWYC